MKHFSREKFSLYCLLESEKLYNQISKERKEKMKTNRHFMSIFTVGDINHVKMDLKIENKITKQQQQQTSGFPTWIERTKWDHLHPLIKLFIPIKSLQYYNDYYRFIRIVHRCNRINGKLLNENLYNRLYRFYQTMVTVQLLKFVHLIILYLSRNYTDNMIKVLQGDLSDLFQMNQFIQLLTAFPMMLGLKNFEQLF